MKEEVAEIHAEDKIATTLYINDASNNGTIQTNSAAFQASLTKLDFQPSSTA